MTPEEWWRRANEKRLSAGRLLDERKSSRDCYHLVGTAVEFAFKAVIAKRERFNQWPDQASRPDLYTHNLRVLFNLLGVDHSALPPSLRASLKTVLSWSRSMEYQGGRMPRKEAAQMYTAAFGTGGVIEWLKTL
ncbi:hypothetical protein [Shinella sp.]|uniref:hypothetical protein n=1 Tax=Shinella sp. TaxID=1870904 RepID=UPI00258B3E27|nr:hypothetical protein [Shinella sp.]MCW5712754.1 hypothetical protein [Shinella sp.]